MRNNFMLLALLAPLGAMASVNATSPLSLRSLAAPSITTTAAGDAVTISFTGLQLESFNFQQLSPLFGTLTNVSVHATLDSTTADAWASDLTVYVSSTPDLNSAGLLQVGGGTDVGADEGHSWANGDDGAPGTEVIDSVALTTPISFTGAMGRTAWLGYGYDDAGDVGTWSGSVTLTGVSLTAAVPEPSSWALLAAGGAGLAGFVARRRRQAAR